MECQYTKAQCQFKKLFFLTYIGEPYTLKKNLQKHPKIMCVFYTYFHSRKQNHTEVRMLN